MNRITKVDGLLRELVSMLPKVGDADASNNFLASADGTEILTTEESEAEALANLFDQIYGEGTVNTGYYDPEEDKRNGEVDDYTGLYYVTIA